MQAGTGIAGDGGHSAPQGGTFPVESAKDRESRLMMKELALMSMERMLVSKAIVLRQREQALERDEENLRQRRRKFCEARAVLDVQRASLEREIRIFDRVELLTVVEEDSNAEANPDSRDRRPGTRKRRLWQVMNDAFLSDDFDDHPPTKERRVDSGPATLGQGSDVAEVFDTLPSVPLRCDLPSGVERNALKDEPGKVTLSKSFMTESEYNFFLDMMGAFRKWPDITISWEIYERMLPEACLLRQGLKAKFRETIDNWNAIPSEERASAPIEQYPVAFLGDALLQVAFDAAVTIPEDFVQVVEVVLNIAMLLCWRGDRKLLEKTLKTMSAIATVLSAMVWKGHLDYHDRLVQLNVFIIRTLEQLATHKNSEGVSSLPADITTLFVPVPHFAASFLHPVLLRRPDVVAFLVKYVTDNDETFMHVAKGLFRLFQEDLDIIAALNRDIIPISEHVLQILNAPNDEAIRVSCLKLLLYGDESVGNTGILDGLCSMRCSVHRWNVLFIARRISQVLEGLTGERYKWKEALWWLKWVLRSKGKLPDGWKGEITEWLKLMLPEVRGAE
ncbi:hypothetical protein BSKO_09307 [Bryopsis sp. KO-2023]|nr:hypothetical protein BSKO_09307 [Bryopsis sp. KO-2023]